MQSYNRPKKQKSLQSLPTMEQLPNVSIVKTADKKVIDFMNVLRKLYKIKQKLSVNSARAQVIQLTIAQ